MKMETKNNLKIILIIVGLFGVSVILFLFKGYEPSLYYTLIVIPLFFIAFAYHYIKQRRNSRHDPSLTLKAQETEKIAYDFKNLHTVARDLNRTYGLQVDDIDEAIRTLVNKELPLIGINVVETGGTYTTNLNEISIQKIDLLAIDNVVKHINSLDNHLKNKIKNFIDVVSHAYLSYINTLKNAGYTVDPSASRLQAEINNKSLEPNSIIENARYLDNITSIFRDIVSSCLTEAKQWKQKAKELGKDVSSIELEMNSVEEIIQSKNYRDFEKGIESLTRIKNSLESIAGGPDHPDVAASLNVEVRIEPDASNIKLRPSREEFNGSLAEARNILWFLRDTEIAGKYERLLDEIEERSRYAWEKQDAREWQQVVDKLETAVQQVFDLMKRTNPNLFYAMVFREAIQLSHEDHVERALEVAKHIPPSFQDYDEVLQFIDKCFNRLREQRQRLAPSRGSGNPEIPGGMVDQVHFTVTSPSLVRPSDSFVVDIWAHLERQREEVIRRAREAFGGSEIHIKSKGPVKVARGSVLSVRLKFEEFVVENSEDTILWNNEIGNATFLVTVPRSVAEGPKSGLATIHVNGLQIARIYFIIQVGKMLSEVNHIPTQQERNRKAFASYASADRDDVLARVQGIQKVAPQLDIFLDVVSLRSGQYWDQELWKVIPSNDVFYLFWSLNAAKSQWVEKEWRCALKSRGLDFIDPVPLISPEEVPPPPELASKHFNDWVLAYMRGKRQ